MEDHCIKLFGVAHFCICIKGNGKYQKNGTEVVTVKIMTHVLHYTALFTCERASSTVQVVGKFWSLHNPQKLRMRLINMVGLVTLRGNLHLKVKFCIWTNSPRQTNSPHFTVLKKGLFFLISGFWQICTGFCLLPDVYFNNMPINRWQNF